MKSFHLAALIIFFLPHPGFSVDMASALSELTEPDWLPRPLVTEDIDALDSNRFAKIEPYQSDFNRDGTEDVAISGKYDLAPKSQNPFFLLVGTWNSQKQKYESLYFETYKTPVFIHPPGTTGPGDGGTQAFSISFCVNCEDGFDLFWDPGKKSFLFKQWDVTVQSIPVRLNPHINLSEEQIQNLLSQVGTKPEVRTFLKKAQKRNWTYYVEFQKEEAEENFTLILTHERNKKKTDIARFRVLAHEGKIVESEQN